MGGPSEEYEVSLKSGQGAAEALAHRGYHVELVGIPRSLTVQEARTFTKRVIQRLDADVIFIALHGTFGEDGTIQQICEELHVAYTGSDATASRLGMDKIASRRRFLQAGLAVPRWLTLHQPCTSPVPEWYGARAVQGQHRVGQASALEPDVAALDGWYYPLVVKPSDQGSSVGITLVSQPQELSAAVECARRYSPIVLIEEFIRGRELTVGVMGDEALPIVEIVPKRPFFDFTAKYTAGMTDYHVPAMLEPQIACAVQEVGRRAHQAIGCRHFSRADLILTEEGKPVVLEVNTIPGLTPTSLLPKAAACIGLTYDDLCEQLVEMAFAASSPTAPVLSS